MCLASQLEGCRCAEAKIEERRLVPDKQYARNTLHVKHIATVRGDQPSLFELWRGTARTLHFLILLETALRTDLILKLELVPFGSGLNNEKKI